MPNVSNWPFITPTTGDKVKQFFTPGLESILSAIPALLGAYESARGVPAGAPLQMLGSLGLQHAANRQQEMQSQADLAARLNLLAQRGLLPQGQDFLKTIESMSPEAAQKELADVEATELARQQAEATANYHLTFGPNGEAFWVNPKNPAEKLRDPSLDKPANLKGSELELWLRQNPGKTVADYNEFKAKNKLALYTKELAKANETRLAMAGPMTKARIAATMDAYKDQPPLLVPQLRNLVIVDRTQLKPVQLARAGDLFDHPDKYVALDRVSATSTLPALLTARKDLLSLADEASKVLPHATGNVARDFLRTKLNEWKLAFEAKSNPTVAAFKTDRLNVAFQLQRVLTGSTRPIAWVEFKRVAGEDVPTGLTPEGEAVMPSPNDSKETAQKKWEHLLDLLQLRLEGMNLAPAAWQDLLKGVISATPPDVITTPTPGEEPEERPEKPDEEF